MKTYEDGIRVGEANIREYKNLVRKLQKENDDLSRRSGMWERRAIKAERTVLKRFNEFVEYRIKFNIFGIMPKNEDY